MHRRVRHLNPAQCGAQIAMDARFITSLADGDPVSTWSSRAPATIQATQTLTSRPTYRVNSIGGRPALEFDGSNDFLAFDAAGTNLMNGVPSIMATVVVKIDGANDANQNTLWWSTNGGVTQARFGPQARVGSSAVARIQSRRLDADSQINGSTTGNTATACIAGYIGDPAGGGDFFSAVNGINGAATNYAATGNYSATNSAAANIGAISTTVNRLDGFIAAVVVMTPMPAEPVRRRIRHSLGFSFRIATH